MSSRLRRVTTLALSLLMFVVLIPVPRSVAEEGMFLPDAISTLPLDKLAKRGLKITAKDLYDPNGVSIKDAVVIVDGGTGEFVSADGLLLTNHHVAFDALVAASTPSKNYGETGFTAMSRAEELPAQGYTVTITQSLKDVTSEVLAGVTDAMSPIERNRAIQTKIRSMQAEDNDAEGISVRVQPMNEGLSYYSFTYLILRDVRIAYAPPKSIGFFGGDDDNFEWPRHCGDFTFMRAYVGPDGKPADYSPNNVPFKPKKFLTLSMEGVKDGELNLVLGYPGSTRRYRESYSVAYNQDVNLPFQVDVLTNEIAILESAGRRDPELRVRLQGSLADLNNTLKNYAGSILAMRRADIVGQKRASEAEFIRWVNQDAARKTKYGAVLSSLEKAYGELSKTSLHDLLLNEVFGISDLIGIIFFAEQVAADRAKPENERNPALSAERIDEARGRIAATLEDRNTAIERENLAFFLRKADELPADQKIAAIEKRLGSYKGEARRQAEIEFARDVLESKQYAKTDALSKLFDMSIQQLREIKDPLVSFAIDLGEEEQASQIRTQVFNANVGRLRPILIQGMSEMHGKISYPDANRTLRFSYGDVKGYVPREAISETPFTTLAGVIEKDTGREPFNSPERLKQLYRSRDFGEYAMPGGANVPVNFISTADIIGGNSGSPVLNGRGEQVGIVFDGNYEGLGNDFFFSPERGRTIAVDIRYVLFVTDKFGGAGWILKELQIAGAVKGKAK